MNDPEDNQPIDNSKSENTSPILIDDDNQINSPASVSMQCDINIAEDKVNNDNNNSNNNNNDCDTNINNNSNTDNNRKNNNVNNNNNNDNNSDNSVNTSCTNNNNSCQLSTSTATPKRSPFSFSSSPASSSSFSAVARSSSSLSTSTGNSNNKKSNNSNKVNCNRKVDSMPSSPSSGKEKPVKHLVHWFRKGLRLHDQPALLKGLQECTTFRCVYLIDPWFSTQTNCGINKWHFLLQSLEDLDNNLHKLGSRLFVIRGQPAEVFPPLFKDWSITHLSFEEDPEPFGKIRDAKIAKMCKEMNIQVICEISHTLYKLNNIIEKCGGEIPLTYSQFQNIISELEIPDEPAPTVTIEIIGQAYTPVSEDHANKYAVPTLEELGFTSQPNHQCVWVGGETEALQRLARHLEHKAWVATFGKPKLTSLSLLCATQTGLGPYLRFGCISARLLYHQLTYLYGKLKKSNPPLTLYGQLLWREFFYCVATNNPNFDKMRNNPLCVQIAWNSNLEALAKWANGQTGYPWIDAIQTQLHREGWIHQIAKHATICFLTRGILWISWEEGMKIFDELLIDADWSVNAGTWMWLSCSSFFQRICHIYCPVSFGRKMDPQGDYIRRYLPVLRNIPNEFIHEPWKAPMKIQKEANCIIGKHYPQPIVNHQEAMRINQERMKQVFRILIKGLDLKNSKY